MDNEEKKKERTKYKDLTDEQKASQRAAVAKYQGARAEIKLRMAVEEKKKFEACAEAFGKSLNAFAIEAMNRMIREENLAPESDSEG